MSAASVSPQAVLESKKLRLKKDRGFWFVTFNPPYFLPW
jgi:hypothetical protein